MTQPPNKPTSKSELLKFRPVFTLDQIDTILSLVLHAIDRLPICEDFDSDKLVSIKRVLIPLKAKIEVGAISPSHKLSEHAALKRFKAGQDEAYMNGTMTPEEEKEYEANTLGL